MDRENIPSGVRLWTMRATLMLAAILAFADVSIAQNSSSSSSPGACQQGKEAAIRQIEQNYNVLYAELQNEETEAVGVRQKAVNKCNVDNDTDQTARNSCILAAEKTFRKTIEGIEDRMTDLGVKERTSMRTVSAGVCAPSAAELSQLISSLGQAVGQVTQGTAQIISASKGKGAGSGGGTGTPPGEHNPPEATATPHSQSTKKP